MDVQGVSLSTMHQQYGRAGCIPFHRQQYGQLDMQGVPLSTTNNVNIQGVSQSIAYSVDVQGVFIFLHLCKVFFKCRNAGLMASCQSGTEMNKYANAGIRYSPIPE